MVGSLLRRAVPCTSGHWYRQLRAPSMPVLIAGIGSYGSMISIPPVPYREPMIKFCARLNVTDSSGMAPFNTKARVQIDTALLLSAYGLRD